MTDTASSVSFAHVTELEIPFPDSRLALIALKALEVDKELRPKEIQRILYINEDSDTVLRGKFSSDSEKMIKLSTNSFMEMVNLVKATQEAFGNSQPLEKKLKGNLTTLARFRNRLSQPSTGCITNLLL